MEQQRRRRRRVGTQYTPIGLETKRKVHQHLFIRRVVMQEEEESAKSVSKSST